MLGDTNARISAERLSDFAGLTTTICCVFWRLPGAGKDLSGLSTSEEDVVANLLVERFGVVIDRSKPRGSC